MAAVKDSIARWYADVNDDIRQKVIEEGWYGRQLSGNEMRNNVEASISQHPDQLEAPQQFAEVYGRDPHVPSYVEGIGARGVDDLNGEASKHVAHDFYDYEQGNEARSFEAEANELYGYDDYNQAEAADLYGYEPEPEEWQGYQRPDIEQEQ